MLSSCIWVCSSRIIQADHNEDLCKETSFVSSASQCFGSQWRIPKRTHLDKIFNRRKDSTNGTTWDASYAISIIPPRFGTIQLSPISILWKGYRGQNGDGNQRRPQSLVQCEHSLLFDNRPSDFENGGLACASSLHPSLDQIKGKTNDCSNYTSTETSFETSEKDEFTDYSSHSFFHAMSLTNHYSPSLYNCRWTRTQSLFSKMKTASRFHLCASKLMRVNNQLQATVCIIPILHLWLHFQFHIVGISGRLSAYRVIPKLRLTVRSESQNLITTSTGTMKLKSKTRGLQVLKIEPRWLWSMS